MKPVLPGQFPYKRGIHSQGYRDVPCASIPLAGFGDPQQANEELRMLAAEGASGAWIRVDTHPGVVIGTAGDLATLLRGLDLANFRIYFAAVENAPAIAALWTVAARELGYDPATLSGGVANDVLGDAIVKGGSRVDADSAIDLISWALDALPLWTPLIPGAVARETAIDAGFELGAVAWTVVQYVERLRSLNLVQRLFPEHSMLVLTAGTRILDDVAKFRAARLLHAMLLKERTGISGARTVIHAWTAEAMMAARQTDVNLIRVALGSLAAVLGGAQAVSANPSQLPPDLFDERTALRTVQVLLHETGIPLTADPCGGSEAVERRTNEISEEAFSMIDRDLRWMRAEYHRRADELRRKTARGERVVVGVNRYVGNETETRRAEAPLNSRPSAINHSVEASLAKIETVPLEGVNIMPALLSAANAGAAMADMSAALRRARSREHL
jgi:methylmalonyl-CoA mutase N-terminal domain/subunit